MLEGGGGEKGGGGPDVGAHEEAAGEDIGRGRGEGGADVVALWGGEVSLGGIRGEGEGRYFFEIRHHVRLVGLRG